MAIRAWDTIREEQGIKNEDNVCSVTPEKATILLGYAQNLYDISTRFANSERTHIKPFLDCLRTIVGRSQ